MTVTAMERRTTRGTVEVRAAKDSAGRVLAGYAAKFDTLSQNLGGFVETIERGAFAKTLADGGDVLARFNHDDHALLGRTTAGTLRVGADDVGLWYEVDLPDTTIARDLEALAERGDVYQSSFAFYVDTNGDDWGVTEQGMPLRILRSVRLVDVAPVVSPAYLDTEAGLRSFAAARGLALEEVRAAAAAGSLAPLLTPAPAEDPPRATHGLVTVRRRLADMAGRRPPWEPRATHSRPSPSPPRPETGQERSTT